MGKEGGQRRNNWRKAAADRLPTAHVDDAARNSSIASSIKRVNLNGIRIAGPSSTIKPNILHRSVLTEKGKDSGCGATKQLE